MQSPIGTHEFGNIGALFPHRKIPFGFWIKKGSSPIKDNRFDIHIIFIHFFNSITPSLTEREEFKFLSYQIKLTAEELCKWDNTLLHSSTCYAFRDNIRAYEAQGTWRWRGFYHGIGRGKSSLKIVVAEYRGSRPMILYAREEPSFGIRKGAVIDLGEASQAINRALVRSKKCQNPHCGIFT